MITRSAAEAVQLCGSAAVRLCNPRRGITRMITKKFTRSAAAAVEVLEQGARTACSNKVLEQALEQVLEQVLLVLREFASKVFLKQGSVNC